MPVTKADIAACVNIPVLRKGLEHITAHPEEWSQGDWLVRTECGTAGCLAGTLALQAGFTPFWLAGEVFAEMAIAPDGDQRPRFISVVAVEALLGPIGEGLFGPRRSAYRQIREMFGGSNSLYVLWSMAAELTNGEITVPADLPCGWRTPSWQG